MIRMDLNADVGEGILHGGRPVEEFLLPLVTSANVACGVHAGDEGTMGAAAEAAARAGVAIGAHPGLGDPGPGRIRGVGGRQDREIPAEEAREEVARQVAALARVLGALGVPLRHVKPHGALYNRAAREPALAAAVAEAVAPFRVPVVALAGGRVFAAGAAVGIRAVPEAFPERGYRADGTLVPRGEPGALVEDPAEAAARAVSIATRGEVRAVTGEVVRVRAETLCIHGDSPRAVETARAVRAALEKAGVEIRRF